MTHYPNIAITNEYGFPVDEARLFDAAVQVMAQHEIDPMYGVTIVVTDDLTSHRLNWQFREVDAPTDVLSFPAEAPSAEVLEEIGEEAAYMGDLIIAFPYATAQAEREGYNADDGFMLLVVHGMLHLIGYDHDTPDNRASMWAAQDHALLALGISPEIVPTLEG
ncbi:MAG: rRNA maturation RNase YbeY [Armatimonadetes bacterium]|nr:rRNA maturation RNase YbeY [Anaerolineae bacterium]